MHASTHTQDLSTPVTELLRLHCSNGNPQTDPRAGKLLDTVIPAKLTAHLLQLTAHLLRGLHRWLGLL